VVLATKGGPVLSKGGPVLSATKGGPVLSVSRRTRAFMSPRRPSASIVLTSVAWDDKRPRPARALSVVLATKGRPVVSRVAPLCQGWPRCVVLATKGRPVVSAPLCLSVVLATKGGPVVSAPLCLSVVLATKGGPVVSLNKSKRPGP